jgi:hypothetical protein
MSNILMLNKPHELLQLVYVVPCRAAGEKVRPYVEVLGQRVCMKTEGRCCQAACTFKPRGSFLEEVFSLLEMNNGRTRGD